MTLVYILLVAILGAVCFSVWKKSSPDTDGGKLLRQVAELEAAIGSKTEQIGQLKSELEKEKSERSEKEGKSKQQFAQNEQLKAKLEALERERDELRDRVTTHDTDAKRRDKEFDARLAQLHAAEETLKQERQRVIKNEEDQRRMEDEERDRLWNEHEVNVVSALTDLCKLPQFSFSSYTNTNLPDGFDGSLKPDFLIDFLGQYLIFDAKVSKAESMQTYINDAVKKTAEKIKKNPSIFPIVFLVVPTSSLTELKKFHYPKDDYTFFVVGPESLAPILHSLKRITHYELAEQLDPQKRENIINLLAEMDFHVNLRNSADLILTKMGMNILEKTHKVDPELSAEMELKKQEKLKNIPQIVTAAFKKMVANTDAQQKEIDDIVAPKASVKNKDLESAKEILIQKLL